MIQLVHWQEQVPSNFMGDFERIEKAIALAKKFNRANEKEAEFEQKEPDIYRAWKKIKWYMRHSGYESATMGNRTIWHERGWLGTAEVVKIDEKEELKFRYYANSPEIPLFISVADLMKFKKELQQDDAETEYYNPGRYVKALSEKTNIRKRKDIDDDFIPEIEA